MSIHRPIRTRAMSIEAALHWAFAVEKARVDFDQYGVYEFDHLGVDPLWRGMQMKRLGTSVDGGGFSDPAVDAQIIAAAVEALPIDAFDELGQYHTGRALTEGDRRALILQMVEMARAGIAPDWGKSDRLALVCSGWDWDEKAKDFVAGTAKIGSLWRWHDRKRRRWREVRGVICPITETGSAAGIAAKRWIYMAWYGALLHLLGALQGYLHTIELTDTLPDMSPWRKEKGQDL
jgi:hypothetical protein